MVSKLGQTEAKESMIQVSLVELIRANMSLVEAGCLLIVAADGSHFMMGKGTAFVLSALEALGPIPCVIIPKATGGAGMRGGYPLGNGLYTTYLW